MPDTLPVRNSTSLLNLLRKKATRHRIFAIARISPHLDKWLDQYLGASIFGRLP